jgi:hypothetical protein
MYLPSRMVYKVKQGIFLLPSGLFSHASLSISISKWRISDLTP